MAFKTNNTEPGTWTDEAAGRIAGSIGRMLMALADGDLEGCDAEIAKAKTIMNNPNSKHK